MHLFINRCSPSQLFDSSRDPLFTYETLSFYISFFNCLDFLTIPSCSSIFLFHWIFQEAEILSRNPQPQAQQNKEPNSWVLLQPLFLFFYFHLTESIPTPVRQFVPGTKLYHLLYPACVLICHRVYMFLFLSALPFRCVDWRGFVLKSHYVSYWISAEPFRAVWLSY